MRSSRSRPIAKSRLIAAASALVALAGCGEFETGPIRVSAIGSPPQLVNPNLVALDPSAAFLAEAIAQGLVRFDANGEIEPALAQSWIVSDDGLRYTFRIRRIEWVGGGRVTAEQVAMRLRAAISRASRNRLKPVFGSIQNVVAMTDEVLEIGLSGPRPNLLQLLAQPELAIILNRRGTGPYQIDSATETGAARLSPRRREEDESAPASPDLLLQGDGAGLAVARFAAERSDLVVGGTIGDLAFARAAGLPNNRLSFDPVRGLFGLVFTSTEGAVGDPAVRRALSMAVDRDSLIDALDAPGLEPGVALIPAGIDELPRAARPDWATGSLPMRREAAARAIAALETPLRVRVAMPNGPGHRILFAHLRRDWRRIGVEAVRVAPEAAAELRLVDEVAPAVLASWYLRQFSCEVSRVCDPGADAAMETARTAQSLVARQLELRKADMILTAMTPYIPIGSPVRWSLVSRRLTGFRPNMFARHPANTLIAEEN